MQLRAGATKNTAPPEPRGGGNISHVRQGAGDDTAITPILCRRDVADDLIHRSRRLYLFYLLQLQTPPAGSTLGKRASLIQLDAADVVSREAE